MPHTSDCSLNSDYAMPNNTTEFYFPFLVASILNWGNTHHNRSYINTKKPYTAYNLDPVTPQPEGPTNSLTNCICKPRFYIPACFNTVTNFCSVPAARLKHWMANPILCFVTSHMLINFSFELIKISFTKCFLNDYRQFINSRYKE